MNILSLSLPELIASTHAHAGRSLLCGLDVDGTILDYDGTLSDRVHAALHAHVRAGTRVVISTGRGVFGAVQAAARAGLDSCLAVCSNGAMVVAIGDVDLPENFPSGDLYLPSSYTRFDSHPASLPALEGSFAGLSYRVIYARVFDPREHVKRLSQAFPQAHFAVEGINGPHRVNRPFPPGELIGPTVRVKDSELIIQPATRVTLRLFDMDSEQLSTALSDLGMSGHEYSVGWTAWLDIAPTGVSKAQALSIIAEAYHVQTTVCAGDGTNDIPMLTWADIGAAMGGSPEPVRAACAIELPTVKEDGLAVLLEALLTHKDA